MSVTGRRSAAARLLARALVIAGTVAGASGVWLASDAAAQGAEPASEQSVVDTGTGLVADVLAPAAPLVQRETPLTPVVDSLTGTLRETGSTLDPVVESPTEPPEDQPPPEHDADEPQHDSPLRTPPEHDAAPPTPLEPAAELSGTALSTTSASATEPATERSPEQSSSDQDGPERPAPAHRSGAQPITPAPTTGGTDNTHGSPTGFGFYWHDIPGTPGISPVNASRHPDTDRLVGVAGPQPGTTPD